MTDVPFHVVKRDDLAPVCPHCDARLPEVYIRTKGLGFVEAKSIMYFCPHCENRPAVRSLPAPA